MAPTPAIGGRVDGDGFGDCDGVAGTATVTGDSGTVSEVSIDRKRGGEEREAVEWGE